MSAILADGFRPEPYWWADAPRKAPVGGNPPAAADIVIVGSGILGLNVAIPLARAGRSVVLLEAGSLGRGASTRLAGFIGRSLLHSLPTLIGRYGKADALAMFAEAGEAHFFLLDWLKREEIDAGLLYRGRFTAAHSAAAYEKLARGAAELNRLVPLRYEMCPAGEQRREIGSDFYHGGMIWPEHGTLHPGRYHDALVERARRAGVAIFDGLAVERVRPSGERFIVETAQGRLDAREIVFATNGLTREERAAAPWLRRRVIPVTGHQIVTEPLSPELMRSVKPTGRAMHDTKANIYWDRPTPDDRRLLFGARTGARLGDAEATARVLHKLLVRVYPQLAGIRIGHAWQGVMGFTFDRIPHIGRTPDGAWYGMVCNAQGLPIGTYLGHRLADRILDRDAKPSIFWNRDLPTWPFYDGDPWFLPAVLASYDFQDRENLFSLMRTQDP